MFHVVRELELSHFSQNCWSSISRQWGSVGNVSYVIPMGRRDSPGHSALSDTWQLLSVHSSLQSVLARPPQVTPKIKTAVLKVIAWMPFPRIFWILLTSKNPLALLKNGYFNICQAHIPGDMIVHRVFWRLPDERSRRTRACYHCVNHIRKRPGSKTSYSIRDKVLRPKRPSSSSFFSPETIGGSHWRGLSNFWFGEGREEPVNIRMWLFPGER